MSGLDGLGWPDEYDGPDNIKDILHDKEIDRMNENKSDTPETDALLETLAGTSLGKSHEEMVVTLKQVAKLGKDKFQQLERERDEARRQAEYYRDLFYDDKPQLLPWETTL